VTTLLVEQLVFTFAGHVGPFQYEQAGVVVPGWPAGAKVVDIVANEPRANPTLNWLIEAKDYRVITFPPKPANLKGLANTVDQKVRATLASLPKVAAATPASAATAHAGRAITAGRRRVVLHLEPHPPSGTRSALFPSGFAASVLQKLKQLVKDIDANPLVLDIARTPAAGVPWVVS
jgi:hypothetical protein